TTSLNLNAEIEGQGFDPDKANARFTAVFSDSRIDSLTFDQLALSSTLTDGLLRQGYEYRNGQKFIEGTSQVDFSRDMPPVSLKGNAQNINLAQIFGKPVASTQLNFDYNVEIRGLTLNKIHGRANLDIKTSIIDGDTVR